MTISEKYDKMSTGIILRCSSSSDYCISLFFFLQREIQASVNGFTGFQLAGVETNIISLCVFPNVLDFSSFQSFRHAKGIAWSSGNYNFLGSNCFPGKVPGMKYFIIAGEQSGDLHGSNLVRELKASDRDAEIVCWGGDLMEAAGARLLMHYRKTAFMGFTVVLKNLGTISRNLSLCKKQITEYKPDVVILIDYPGFNLRIAKFAKNAGFRVFYYISPKFWAWNEGRVKKVKKYVDRMYIIFPFETEFYGKYDIPVKYRGNPLVDEIEKRKSHCLQGRK